MTDMIAADRAANSLSTEALGPAAFAPRHAHALRIWLCCIALLIVAMILVGGATRLTHSGLSITVWKPIMGVIPPLSAEDWHKAFATYQKIPEYTELNQGMSLDQFKAIFWWEWTHRLLGRLIGVVFLVPFLAFWVAGYIPRAWLPRLLGLFVLGGLQGAVGWYMVKSGLVDRVDVSQYRLAAHLGVAVLILFYALWLLFSIGDQPNRTGASPPSRAAVTVAGLVVLLVYLQMLAGALVAGLDAGIGYNTWPLMNGAFIPNGLDDASPWFMNLFENPLAVQFDHRMLGYTVVLASIAQALWLALRGNSPALTASALMLAGFALLQGLLGVWTLLLAVPIGLGLAHQAGAVAVFVTAVHHLWLTTREPATAPLGQSEARA